MSIRLLRRWSGASRAPLVARSQPVGRLAAVAVAAAALAALGGCIHGQAERTSGRAPAPGGPPAARPAARRLTLLHCSDFESALLSSNGIGGIARFVSMSRGLAARDGEPALVVAAGDTFIPAPELSVRIGDANAVTLANNRLGLAATSIGNHEFDLGESFLADMVRASRFPYLSATLDIASGPLAALWIDPATLGPDSDWLADHPGRILASGRVCLGGELVVTSEGSGRRCSGLTVGLVGITTEHLHAITKGAPNVRPAKSRAEIVERVQREVDRLTAEGVDIIVALSHLQGVENEIGLVEAGLTGVDAIVAGGGDNRLANSPSELLAIHTPDPICAAEHDSCFPLVRIARDGRPVAIVATDGRYEYVGHLSLSFDELGHIRGVDTKISRPVPVSEQALSGLGIDLAGDESDFETVVRKRLGELSVEVARTPVFLNGERQDVRTRETNLGDLTADALAWGARRHLPEGSPAPLFAMKNGGGIRSSIGKIEATTLERRGGSISELDLETVFRFENRVAVVTTTHRLLRETLEVAFDSASLGGGAFPQVSREVYLEYVPRPGRDAGADEPDASARRRIRTFRVSRVGLSPLEVVRDGETVDPEREITIATLDFLARGGDRYFEARQSEIRTTVLERAPGVPLTELEAFRLYIQERAFDLESYPDPDPKRPESFGRLRPVEGRAPKGAEARPPEDDDRKPAGAIAGGRVGAEDDAGSTSRS